MRARRAAERRDAACRDADRMFAELMKWQEPAQSPTLEPQQPDVVELPGTPRDVEYWWAGYAAAIRDLRGRLEDCARTAEAARSVAPDEGKGAVS